MPKEEQAISKAEVMARKKADADQRKPLVEQYKLEHSSYNILKVYLMKHFGKIIPKFGKLGGFSTSIIELNHKPLNLAYNKSNKVDATEQTLRYAGQKDTINIRVANCTHLLQGTTTN